MINIPWHYKWLKELDKSVGVISSTMKLIAVVLMSVMMLLAIVDIVQRAIGLGLTLGATEGTEVLLIGVIFFMLISVQREKQHIAADFFFNRFPRRVQNMLNITAILLGLAFCGLLFWQSLPASYHSWLIREVKMGATDTPFWPGRFAVTLGLFFCCIQLVFDLVSSFWGKLKE